MKIAVAYENGDVFQHFGHTEQFKVYETEEGKVISSEIIGTNGAGHSALAELLAGESIDVLICGGLGSGAQAALEARGIELYAGASGSADEAVAAYLRGELVNTGANCDHHDHHGEGHSCEEHKSCEVQENCGNRAEEYNERSKADENCGKRSEDEGCGGCGEDEACGGCGEGGCEGCPGCHARPQITGKNVGKKCRTHYRGTFNDGTQFDSSYDRGEPLEFVCGAGMMIYGFDAAVANMEVGETIQVHLLPEEAYGEVDPAAIFPVEIAQLPGSEGLSVGEHVYLQNNMGQSFPVRVTAKDEKIITFDANHEMAGKELNFTIELVEILDA